MVVAATLAHAGAGRGLPVSSDGARTRPRSSPGTLSDGRPFALVTSPAGESSAGVGEEVPDKKPTRQQLSEAGKKLQNPHAREADERKAAQILRKGRKTGR
jgi:hypothetical protein